MKKPTDSTRGSLDILEEAFHLLRQIPWSVLLLHFMGTFPFLLGFLYFLTDMSRAPFAHLYVAEAAIALSILYIWMKCWQSAFCGRIYSHLMGQEPQTYRLRGIVRLLTFQGIIQPYSLILLPVAFLILLPFGWTFAFFQNVLVLGCRREDLRDLMKTSWHLAMLWPAQNHRLLLVLSLFTLIVWINVVVLLLLLPAVIRMILGIETIFSLSGFHLLNTTFFSVTAAITYACIHPLIAVVYTLRCFYGEAIESGADLLAELQDIRKAS